MENADNIEIIEQEMNDMDTAENYEETENFSVGSMYHGKPVHAIHFHNNIFFSGGEDDKVVAWKDDIIWERKLNDTIVDIKSSGSRIAVAAMDGDILILNNEDNASITELFLLNGPNEVICLYIKKKITMAGSQDGLIWVFKDDTVLNVLSGHSGPVTQIDTSENTVVSCSEDGTVITWDPVNNQIIHKLNSGGFAHEVPVVSLCIFNGYITGDVGGKIVMSINGKAVGTAHHHQDSVECLARHDNLIISADVSGKLTIWDYNTKIERSSTIIDTVITCMQLDSKFIYIGGQDGIVRKFDILSGAEVFQYLGHTSQVLKLEVTDQYIISGSDDGNAFVFIKDHTQYDNLESNDMDE